MQSLHDSEPSMKSELDLTSTQMEDDPANKSEPDLPSVLLEDEKESSTKNDLPPDVRGRPSALLSSRCPICFGGDRPVLKHSRCVSKLIFAPF
jgi:hypothetical protein